MRHLSAIVFMALVLTASCKKKENSTIDSCLNGKLDGDEAAIDCGGSYGSCPSTEFPSTGFMVYGEALTMPFKQLSHSNNWSLYVSNDSVSVKVNLGTDGLTGTYPISPRGSAATYNGLNYSILVSGIYSISQHSTSTHKMSGFFRGNSSVREL